jgi:hypothetical protein
MESGMRFIHKKCGGLMMMRWGNAYGVFYDCQGCSHIAMLPTKKQIELRPELLESELKNNNLRIEK